MSAGREDVSAYDRLVWPEGTVEKLLYTGERRRELIAYFGEAEYARLQPMAVAAAAVATALLASGCSGGAGSGDSDTIKVAYQKFGTFTQMDAHMKETAKTFEAANPGMKVEFVPIAAQNDDYFTKLALMNRSAATAPDVMYEDTFKVKSDAAAGYLLPLDEYTDAWEDWDAFYDNAKEAGVG